ncbi:TPA: hypothetical protein DEA21_04125 [Candidatus Uhrbacteria bacterium]|nr:hypothetical protein [Candidatus Uhrbacteria bacterium]HCU31651.1 hypothetical protein [Candidatus Uhrbacteria bacterium]
MADDFIGFESLTRGDEFWDRESSMISGVSHFMWAVMAIIAFLPLTIGCAPTDIVSEDTGDIEADLWDEDLIPDPETFESVITRTYYVYNPTTGGCSSALRLTARGSRITKILPSGCVVNGTAATAHPSWTTLTSGGVSTLVDTWYARTGDRFDHTATSANYYEWCDSHAMVTVRVTGSSVTGLSYWFTDSTRCVF